MLTLRYAQTFVRKYGFHFLALILLVAAALLTRFALFPTNQASIHVHGFVERNLKANQVFATNAKGWCEIGMVRFVDEQNYNMISLMFRADFKPGVHALQNEGTAMAEYFDMENGELRHFSRNLDGTLEFNRRGTRINGKVKFYADEANGQGSVMVASAFSAQVGLENLTSDQKREWSIFSFGFAIPLLLSGLGVLFSINLAFGIYVGSQVYKGQSVPVLLPFHARRIFSLGWEKPELHGVMLTWVAVIIGIGALWVLFAFFSWQPALLRVK